MDYSNNYFGIQFGLKLKGKNGGVNNHLEGSLNVTSGVIDGNEWKQDHQSLGSVNPKIVSGGNKW